MTLDLNKIYVAASSTEIARAGLWMQRLRDAGFEVMSTWIDNIEKQQGNANPRDAAVEHRNAWANTCLEQLGKAGIVWLLAPGPDGGHGRGAYGEFVAARTLRKVLFASGDTVQSIFGALALEFVEDIDAFTAIVKLRAERAKEMLAARGGFAVEMDAR
jgi:hypothetical protein